MKRKVKILYLRETQAIQASWRLVARNRAFRIKLLIAPGLFWLYAQVTQRLGLYIEHRKGVRLEDHLLTLFPRLDCSVPVFYLLYASLFLLVLTHLKKPETIIRVIELHFLVAVVRQICILAIALDPPSGVIVLRDLFLEYSIYPPHAPLTKDLFFSGHVASIWIYFLCATQRYLKVYLGLASLLMSGLLLCMRAHYTYDVYGAFFFTTNIYLAHKWLPLLFLRFKEETPSMAGMDMGGR